METAASTIRLAFPPTFAFILQVSPHCEAQLSLKQTAFLFSQRLLFHIHAGVLRDRRNDASESHIACGKPEGHPLFLR